MFKKIFVLLTITVLLFITIKPYKFNANPAIPAAVVTAAGIGALAGASAAALEGYRGVENADTVFDRTKVVWSTLDAVKRQAFEEAVSSAISAGVKTVSLTQDMSNWIMDDFIPKMTVNVVPNAFPDDSILAQHLSVDGTKLTPINGTKIFINIPETGQKIEAFDLELAIDNWNTLQLKAAGFGIISSNISDSLDNYAGSQNKILNVLRQILIARYAGASITFEADGNAVIDNWADEVERLLQNVFEHAASAGLALDIADVIATTLDGTDVKWDFPAQTWKDAKGVPLSPDLAVEGVEAIPKTTTGEENPPVEENPPIEGNPPITLPADAVVTITSLTTFFEAIKAKIEAKYPFIPAIISSYNVQVNNCTNWGALTCVGLKVGDVTLGNLKIVDATYINGISSKIKYWVGGIIWFFLGLYIIRKLASIWGSTR